MLEVLVKLLYGVSVALQLICLHVIMILLLIQGVMAMWCLKHQIDRSRYVLVKRAITA